MLCRLLHTDSTGRIVGVLALVGVLGSVLAGCGSAAPSKRGGDAPAATASGAPVAPSRVHPIASSPVDGARASAGRAGATVKVMRTRYGRVLVDGTGRALYLFTRDRKPLSQCHGPCATNWPPLLTAGKPVAGTDARARLLGRSRRPDGSTQVTYSGHPLYHYIGDRHPGEVLCQNVEEFGGRWYVVTQSGTAVP